MEGKVCNHLKSFERIGIQEREPDGTLSVLFKIRCDAIKDKEGYLLTRHFNCFDCSDCSLLKPFELSEIQTEYPVKEVPHYSCRYGDIELQPYIRNCNYNDIVFELVKWYPNTYYGKHNEYNIVGGTAYSKVDPNVSISVSLLDKKECNYVISFIHLIRGKMIEPVSTRPGELEGEDLQNYNRLKRIAKYIVGKIIDSEKAAGENIFVSKKEE